MLNYSTVHIYFVIESTNVDGEATFLLRNIILWWRLEWSDMGREPIHNTVISTIPIVTFRTPTSTTSAGTSSLFAAINKWLQLFEHNTETVIVATVWIKEYHFLGSQYRKFREN